MPDLIRDGLASTETDADAMRRLVAGDPTALQELVHRHANALHLCLLRLLQVPDDAADLAQETFVRVFTHADRFDPHRSFKTWLLAIATNLARDRLRWRRRHPESALEPESPSGEIAGPSRFTDPHATPSEAAELAERSEAVRLAIGELPEELRIPLVLSEFENLGHAEISEVVGCTAKAVEMRLYRARHFLRQRLTAWLLD